MSGLNVMVLKPFWRYCVIYEIGLRRGEAAIPFYTRRRAESFAQEMADSGSMFSDMLVFRKRRFRWRQVEADPILTLQTREAA